MTYIPEEAIKVFNAGLGTDEVVRRQVLNAEGRPVSSRTAREWRQEWKRRQSTDEVIIEDAEVAALRAILRKTANLQAPEVMPLSYPPVEETKLLTKKDSPAVRIARFREAAKAVTALQDEHDPVITHYSQLFDTNKPVAIMWASCMHLGGRYTDHEFIENALNTFLEFGSVFFIGDEIEGFTPSWFHAGSIMEQALQVTQQVNMFDAYMEQFWSKVLGGMWSQHGSMWFEKNQGYTPLKRRYTERGIPFFDGTANLTYQVGDQVYYIVASHEFSGNSQWNKNHPHIKSLRFDHPTADAIIAGDKHTYAVQELQVYTEEFEAGRRASPWVWLIQSGTAKTGPDKYTIKRWGKGEAEWPITVLYPDQHLIKVTRHIEDARRWVNG
jgi:hypothetical protein